MLPAAVPAVVHSAVAVIAQTVSSALYLTRLLYVLQHLLL
jgi:hypothetical protein